jgi:hypothetical protein
VARSCGALDPGLGDIVGSACARAGLCSIEHDPEIPSCSNKKRRFPYRIVMGSALMRSSPTAPP